MNIGWITARMVQNPIRFSNYSYYITEIQVHFVHTKNYFASAIALADGKIGKNIFEFYCKGDYILIEGEYLSIEDHNKNASLIIYIIDVQPAHLIIKE